MGSFFGGVNVNHTPRDHLLCFLAKFLSEEDSLNGYRD